MRKPTAHSFAARRLYWSSPEDMAKRSDATKVYPTGVGETHANQPNLTGSRLRSELELHLPAIDIDFDAQLIPSTTPGHFHLYLDGMRPLSWPQYKRLLRALKRAGVIEKGYYKHSVKRRMTLLRLPWVTKTAAEYGEGYGPMDDAEESTEDYVVLRSWRTFLESDLT